MTGRSDLIVDNYATHKHRKVRTWLAQRPRYHLHYTPTYSSWLNQVERWFGLITSAGHSPRLLQQILRIFPNNASAERDVDGFGSMVMGAVIHAVYRTVRFPAVVRQPLCSAMTR